MITNALIHDSLYVEPEGLSSDTKPTEKIGVNSKFRELDTGDIYYFNGTAWSKVGGN